MNKTLAARENRTFSSTATLVVRGLLLLIGIALLAWGLSDDVRITGGAGLGWTQLAVLLLGVLNILASALRINFSAGLLVCQLLLLVVLAAFEFALRATLAPRYYAPYQLHSRYLYNLIPGASREHRTLPVNGGSQYYSVNSRGFRGEEFAAKQAGIPRIVIYGDSFIHAEFTALENTFAKQLEDLLSAKLGHPVEVINAGIAGYGPDQVLLRLEDELEWLQPDLLIVAVFSGNDFGDLVRNKIFRLAPDNSLLENAHTFSAEIQLNEKLERADPVIKKLVREAAQILRASIFGDTQPPHDPLRAVETSLQQHQDEYQEYVVEGDNVIRMLRSDPYSADISLLPDSPSAQYKLALMDAVIRRISATAQAHDVPLLLLAIPHPMDVLDGSHESGRVDIARYPAYEPSRLTDSIQAMAESQGIDYVNLYQPFRAVDDPAALFLKAGDDHWNDAGQRYAAGILGAHILESATLLPIVQSEQPD